METKRAKNFSEQDKNTLLDIAEQFISVLGNKRTDAISVQEKNKTWEDITNTFNANSQTGPRSTKQLRYLYDTLKRKAREHISNDKVEHYKTGGGTFHKQTDNIDERLVGMLKPQMEPLSNCYDSCAEYLGDVLLDVSTPPDEPCVILSTEVQVPTMPEVATPPSTASVSTATRKRTFTATEEQAIVRPTIKKKAVDCMADRIIGRKNMKDKYDSDLHEKKIKLMAVEEVIKAREEESSSLILDHMKRCHQIVEEKHAIDLESARFEKEIKMKQLQNMNIENEIKTLDLKMKGIQYKQLQGNNNNN